MQGIHWVKSSAAKKARMWPGLELGAGARTEARRGPERGDFWCSACP